MVAFWTSTNFMSLKRELFYIFPKAERDSFFTSMTNPRFSCVKLCWVDHCIFHYIYYSEKRILLTGLEFTFVFQLFESRQHVAVDKPWETKHAIFLSLPAFQHIIIYLSLSSIVSAICYIECGIVILQDFEFLYKVIFCKFKLLFKLLEFH